MKKQKYKLGYIALYQTSNKKWHISKTTGASVLYETKREAIEKGLGFIKAYTDYKTKVIPMYSDTKLSRTIFK